MKNFRKYTVDLDYVHAEDRLQDFWRDTWAVKKATRLAQNAYAQMEEYGGKYTSILSATAHLALKLRHGAGDYKAEIREWADYTGLPEAQFSAANLSYELTQMGVWAFNNWTLPRPLKRISNQLCSSVAFNRPGIGMVHARNMDWELEGLRNSTVLTHYINGPAGDFTSVGLPGLVGVLSGVAKGRFSATINLAPEGAPSPVNGWSAPLLLRRVFENCESYQEAIDMLLASTTVVPVFIQVVGVKKGEACIVEVMPDNDNFYWEYAGTPLAITNHEPDDENYEDITDEEGATDSIPRLEKIVAEAAKCKAKTLKGCLPFLQKPPVWSGCTQQSMVMCAKSGKVLLQ